MNEIKDFSNFILSYFKEVKEDVITNLQMQKILYYVQAYHLAYFENTPLFNGEPEAWVRGPVYREIYDIFKKFGAEPIRFSEELSYEEELKKLNLNEEQQKYISSSLEYFSSVPVNELIFRSHSEEPWLKARKNVGMLEYSNNIITNESMFEYYGNLLKKKNK